VGYVKEHIYRKSADDIAVLYARILEAIRSVASLGRLNCKLDVIKDTKGSHVEAD
jgi:hypothetical protein